MTHALLAVLDLARLRRRLWPILMVAGRPTGLRTPEQLERRAARRSPAALEERIALALARRGGRRRA